MQRESDANFERYNSFRVNIIRCSNLKVDCLTLLSFDKVFTNSIDFWQSIVEVLSKRSDYLRKPFGIFFWADNNKE